MPPKLFDRDRIATHLARRPAGADDFVTRLVLEDLDLRVSTISRQFEKAAILAPDATILPETGRSAIGPFSYTRFATLPLYSGLPLVDPEALALPNNDYDLIVSLFDLQITDDVPGLIARLKAHLRPDGLLFAAAIGGDSLTELRQAFLAADAELSGGAYARVAPFIPLSDAGALLQRAGLALPVTDVETHVVRYADPLRLMRELKALGAQNPLAERPNRMATRGLLVEAATAYATEFSDADGRIRATLEIIWMSGWQPHDSQQKPLKRGSASVRLGDVLGKAGDS